MLLISKFLPRFLVKSGRKRDKSKDCDSRGNEKPYNCRVFLLDDTELTLDIKTSHKGQSLLEQIFTHVNIEEKDYFGVRYLDETQQTQWLIPAKTIAAQLKTPPPHSLYFGVKFYAVDPCKLQEEITRYQFFLQVKRDVTQGRLPLSYELATELAAYAVQSELGDYDAKRHSEGYCSEFRFLPNQTEEFEGRVAQLHRNLRGQVPAVAEYRYLDKVKWLEMYGVDLHQVQGEGNIDYFLGLTPTGIVVYRNKSKVGNYFWPRLSKITFKGKLFMVKVRDRNNVDNTYAFECCSKQACKHLWRCSIEHHAFFRLTSANESYRGKLFSLRSKHRKKVDRSSSTKSTQSETSTRSQPAVVRVPSKRYSRRLSAESLPAAVEAATCRDNEGHEARSSTQRGGSFKPDRGYQSAPESPPRHRTAPWEEGESQKGEKLMFPSRRPQSGSESEAGSYLPRKTRAYPSDTESDFIPNRTRRSRAQPPIESASESEAAYRRHRQKRHHSRKSTDSLPAALDSQADRMMKELNYTGHLKVKQNGSLSSMASEPAAMQAQRRRRKRSRSPGNKKPPEELAQHFKYIDPASEGLTGDQLKDIAYTQVETVTAAPKVKYSPRSKHRHRSSKRRSTGELSEKKPPPPDIPSGGGSVADKPTEYHSSMPSLPTTTCRPESTADVTATVEPSSVYTTPAVSTAASSAFNDLIPHPAPSQKYNQPSSAFTQPPYYSNRISNQHPPPNPHPPSSQYTPSHHYPPPPPQQPYYPSSRYQPRMPPPNPNHHPPANQYLPQYPHYATHQYRHDNQYLPPPQHQVASYSSHSGQPDPQQQSQYQNYLPREPQLGNSPGSMATDPMLPTAAASYNQAGMPCHMREDSGLGTEQDNSGGSHGTPTGMEGHDRVQAQLGHTPTQYFFEQVLSEQQRGPPMPTTPSKARIPPQYYPSQSPSTAITLQSASPHRSTGSPAPPSVPQRTHSLLPGGYNHQPPGSSHQQQQQATGTNYYSAHKYRTRNSGYHSDVTFFQSHSEKMTEL